MSSESIQRMRVAEVMTSDVTTVSPETSTGEVLEIMQQHQISSLPVVDDGKCVGIVTATDLVRLIRETNAALRSSYPHYEDCLWAVDLAHRKLDQQPVSEIMSPNVERISPDTAVCEAARRLSSCSLHHLIVEQDGQLVGFLSSWDLAAAIC